MINTTHAEEYEHEKTDVEVTTVSQKTWYLKFSETWHSMSQAIGLKRLQELIQGTCSLAEEPLWLLGLWYGLHDRDSNTNSLPQEMQQLMLQDFTSKFWFTYRRDFHPIGQSQLTSDVGWGCTIRSGQMMMAEAIARSWWGRTTSISNADSSTPAADAAADRITAAAAAEAAGQQQAVHACAGAATSQLQLLQMFQDHPDPAAPFSIHNICRAGEQHGVVPGQWLGPWVLCKALAAAAAEHHQLQHQQQSPGLQVHVVCDPGGGAPSLQVARLAELLPQQHTNDSQSHNEAAGGSSSSTNFAAGQQHQGLLLLVPLTLGVGKMNERYLPQLAAVLTFPQSVGIVGGRPGASLYFLGVQGSNVLYLDPHDVQEVVQLPAGMSTFHCTTPRLMPMTSIDPSLAIGFYCSTQSDLNDLADRLQLLADTAAGAPLMTVDREADHQQQYRPGSTAVGVEYFQARGQQEVTAEDWELV